MAVIVTVGLANPAVAQQNATLVLRSGERIGGQLVDMGASGLTFRVNGQDRKYPMGQVAVIDFAGGGTNFPASELDKVGDGGVVMANGETVQGKLYDVGGRSPLRITIDLGSGGRRDYDSTDLKRIYVSRPPSSAPGSGAGSGAAAQLPGGKTIQVPATQRWTDTGITVRRGEYVRFTASGEIQLSSDSSDVASPAGSKIGRRPGAPLPGTLAGALLGRIGTAQVFGIGDQTNPLPMPGDGRLFLGINDDDVNDNRGEFTVQIVPGGGATRRR